MTALVYILLCIAWGSTWTAIKIGLQDAPPFWAAGIRMLMAGTVLLIYNYIANNHYPQGLRDKWRVAWPGIFMYGLSYSLVYFGNQVVTSALASILFAVYPFFVILFVPLMVKSELISLRAVLGILIGFSGLVIVFSGPISFDANAFLGGALIVLATLSSAYATVHIRAYLNDRQIFPMITIQMLLGGALMTTLAIFTENLSDFKISSNSVGSIIYLVFFGTIFTFAGYYWLLRKIATVKVSLIAFVTPIVAVFLGYIVLNERLATQDFVGSALVLFGVLLVNIKK